MIRSDWTMAEARAIHALPFADLMNRAQNLHRAHFDPNAIETASLLSIKTGGCPEDCGYCSQSAHHDTGVKATKLMGTEEVLAAAKRAKASGAQRFCMGAAWRSPKDRDMDKLCDMVRGVSDLGLETCMTLGMLSPEQVARLKAAGLDFYNHNIDTSPEYYAQIASTRTMEDRLDTVEQVRKGGIKVCCGGILGMGETEEDRISGLDRDRVLRRAGETPSGGARGRRRSGQAHDHGFAWWGADWASVHTGRDREPGRLPCL